MKKIFAVMLIALLTVASVFAVANFDKSNLSLNAKVVGYHGQYGVSYAYNKAEFAAEVWTFNSPLVLPHEFVARGAKFGDNIKNETFITSDKDIAKRLLVLAVVPSNLYYSAVYEILRTEKSELSVGAGLFVDVLSVCNKFREDTIKEIYGPSAKGGEHYDFAKYYMAYTLRNFLNVCGDIEYAYHFNEHSAITARVVVPVNAFLKCDDGESKQRGDVLPGALGVLAGYSGIGYRYTF